MTMLLRDPDVQAEQAASPPAPEAPPETRPCPNCQAPMAPGQDWCLDCGQAAPGRLGGRPGGRAVATVAALTLALCGGAVAASYAALQDDGATPKPGLSNAQVAQAPPATTPAPAASTPAATPPATPPASSTPAAPPAPPASGPKPTTPPATSSKPVTPAPSPPTAPSNSTGSTRTAGSTGTTTTPKPAAPAPISLKSADVATYDPYTRATATGDAARAVDGQADTSWFATVPDGSGSIGLGLVVDLGKLRGIRELELTTKTPGFRAEIYATDSTDLPPNVLDTRWAHIKNQSDVGSSGNADTIVIGGGSTKYRHLLLWFTAPPKDGFTVRVSELKVLG